MKVRLELVKKIDYFPVTGEQILAKIEIDGQKDTIEKIVKLLNKKFGVENIK